MSTTGPDGIATFDWLPKANQLLQFWPVSEGYIHRRVIVNEDQTGPVTAKLIKAESIRGRVVHADGTPAGDIQVEAYGSGQGLDNGTGRARTATDGSYEMNVSPNEGYAVYIDDKDWAAKSRLDVIVREGRPASGIDFTLTRGTTLRGMVTVGPGNRPALSKYIRLDESGDDSPKEFREPGDRTSRTIRRQFGVTTDAQGRYTIRVGPGTYTLMGPPRTKDEEITVKDEAELVRDFRMPRPEKGPLTGRVVLAGALDRGVAGAKVELWAASVLAIPQTVTTDTDGRFQTDRSLDHTYLHAWNADNSLGAIVEIGADDLEVVIEVAPTAAAQGILLDEKGKIAANQRLAWGHRIYLNEEETISSHAFGPRVKTDAMGRFTLPALVVGQEYDVSLERDGTFHAAGAVRPEKAGSIDIGTLRAGSYRPPGRPGLAEESSFCKDALGPGQQAPPIEATDLDGRPLKLADFRGKYVLLDFWATWCGPCIGEIPRLQAIHDGFGKDERFAILSLSVDEKIDEPRKFQAKRNLPWRQGFLGGGIHAPTPGGFGVRAIPAFVLVGPDGRIVARGMRGKAIQEEVARVLGKNP